MDFIVVLLTIAHVAVVWFITLRVIELFMNWWKRIGERLEALPSSTSGSVESLWTGWGPGRTSRSGEVVRLARKVRQGRVRISSQSLHSIPQNKNKTNYE